MGDQFFDFIGNDDFYRIVFQALGLVDGNCIGHLERHNRFGRVVIFVGAFQTVDMKSYDGVSSAVTDEFVIFNISYNMQMYYFLPI